MKRSWAVVVALLLGSVGLGSLGCTLPRGVIASAGETGLPDSSGELDAGPEEDADVDAFRPDTGAPEDSATPDDAFVPVDVGTDAGCVSNPEVCNGRDDDCNGAIDDATVCRACTAPGSCGDCVRFEAAGHVYQSCPDVSGYEYWARVCWTLGDGYDLVVFETATEQDAVRSAMSTGVDLGDHWIGLMDRETNGSYRWADGSAISYTPTFFEGTPRADEAFVDMSDSGVFDDFPGWWDHRALCELGAPRCTGRAAEDSTCDGVDDDCDGFVDEDCDGTASCSSRVFDRSVYYRCTDDLTAGEAKTECDGTGAALTSITDRFELEVLANLISADAWTGLSQDPAGAESDGGWVWADGTAFPVSDPDWGAMWDGAEPAGGPSEECGYIQDGSGRFRDGVCTNNRSETLCERAIVP